MDTTPLIERLDTVDSTNTYIKCHPELWDRQFCAVVSREQTMGKGRFGRTWISEAGQDLTFSMVFLPSGGVADLSCVTLLAGLAAHRALGRYCGKDLNLKWPNDIHFRDKKIGGILCEMINAKNAVVVIGIGINVNRTKFPEDIAASAASLKTATGINYSIETIFNDIYQNCIELLSNFRVPLDESLIEEWTGASHSIGASIRFVRHNRIDYGILSGINGDGSIRITGNSGETIDGYRGEVLFPDDG